MNNRLIINPLIEENMNEMHDGQFSISQITGHVDIRKENEFISKTKELWCEALDLRKYKEDLKEKYEDDIKKFNDLDYKVNNLKQILYDIFKKIEDFKNKLEEYEKLSDEYEEKLRYIDKLSMSLCKEIQLTYNKTMTENFHYLGKLLIEYEKLERIKDNDYYFENFVHQHFNYIDASNNVVNYDTEGQIERDFQNLSTRVNFEEYIAYKNDCIDRINTICTLYKVKADTSFDGEIPFSYSDGYDHIIN